MSESHLARHHAHGIQQDLLSLTPGAARVVQLVHPLHQLREALSPQLLNLYMLFKETLVMSSISNYNSDILIDIYLKLSKYISF